MEQSEPVNNVDRNTRLLLESLRQAITDGCSASPVEMSRLALERLGYEVLISVDIELVSRSSEQLSSGCDNGDSSESLHFTDADMLFLQALKIAA